MRGAESDLLCLWEKLVHGTIKDKLAYSLQGYEFLRPHLRRIEDVKFEVMLIALSDSLDGKCPFGWTATFNGLV